MDMMQTVSYSPCFRSSFRNFTFYLTVHYSIIIAQEELADAQLASCLLLHLEVTKKGKALHTHISHLYHSPRQKGSEM